ncbi:MAG: DUF6701 domain-containing protein [Pseudomonadota bacterium]
MSGKAGARSAGRFSAGWFGRAVALLLLLCTQGVLADTTLSLKQSWAGNVNYVGTQKTLRTNPNTTNACTWVGSTATTSAALSGIPATATIQAAYLYWAGSGATADYTVTFEGTAYTATSQYTSTSVGYRFFGGVVDVTSKVVSKRNGTYSLTDLTIDNTNNQDNYCDVQAVLGGWALAVVYSDSSEPLRVINLYEGFQYYQNSSITLTLSNFMTPTPLGSNTGKAAHISWEGDPTLSGGGETLTFNGTELTDANNTSGNQFNSVSNIAAVSPSTGAADTAAYGVDFDAYVLDSSKLTAGMTSATTVYSSGQDLVLLSAEIISVPNVPVADLGITMGFSGTMGGGQTVTYTLNVTNSGPNDETGTITVTNTPPAGLTYTGASGTGWTCPSPYTTCTYAGGLANGASANPLTLTATVASSTGGTITNTASVAGTLFDNVSGNDTATDSRTALEADLSLDMTGGSLTPGSNATYTLTVSNGGPDTHSGTITVSDVLPSGLTFVSATGTGWTCNSSVSCTYSSALASGASAPAITLTVAVSAGATQPLTNSATVAGTYYDGDSSNNTDSVTWGTNTTGGCSMTTVGSDTVITCLSDGTVTIPSNVSKVRYLVVGGGGGGGGIDSGDENGAGGGGAGGVLSGTSLTVIAGSVYSVTVGAGGTAGTGSVNGGSGGASTFSSITASGGGGGAREGGHDGVDGGSGGGGSDDQQGGNGTAGQGNDGGDGNNNDGGGGGGGAGATGADGTNDTGGDGGDGVADDITGTSTYYGGGGGGGADDGGNGGAGGLGGGGAGGIGRGAGTAGTANTGGGGGGATGSGSGSAYSGGTGGSGIVVIRYPTSGTPVCKTFGDLFGSVSYANNDGTLNWSTDWTETNDDGSASSGTLDVSGGELRLAGDGSGSTGSFGGPAVQREANLSGYTSATLSFDYRETGNWESSDTMTVFVSNDGGSNWTQLHQFSNDQGSTAQTLSLDITSYLSSNFRVAFVEGASQSDEIFYIDNVQIEACGSSGPNHLRIEHTGSGVTCAPTTLTIKACADASCSSLYTGGGVTGTLTASGTPTVNWVDGAGFSIGVSGSTTESVQVTTAGDVTWGTTSVSPTPGNATTCYVGATASCSFTASLAGFLFDVPHHYSDVEQTITVSAVKQSDSSLACTPAFASTSKTVSFNCGYSDPASGTLPVTVGGSDITCGSASGVSLAFDATGVATTTVRYADVGQMSLSASYSGTSGSETGLVMTGSDPFIAAPASFTVVPTGPYVAGTPFSVTVTAKNASGNTTPNFGAESTTENVSLGHTLTGPAGGNDPALDGTTTLADATFDSGNGVATASDVEWDEVGDINLTATLASASYLGSGLSATGSAATGPFKPAYFDTVVTPGTGTFTYAGQPFTVTVTAMNADGATTQNYEGAYAKAVTLTDANSGTNNSGTLGAFSNATLAAASFTDGVATTTTIEYDFTTKTTAPLETPTSAPLALRATDADSVTSSGHTEGTTPIRSGRLRLVNFYGSELLAPRVEYRAEYWDGNRWLANTLDSTTAIVAGNIATGGLAVNSVGALTNGVGTIIFNTAGAGSYDIAFNLGSGTADTSCNTAHPATTGANLPWLQGYWSGSCGTTPAWQQDPSARVRLGASRAPYIYLRERY